MEEWDKIINEFEENKKAIDWIVNLINRNKNISCENIRLKGIAKKYFKGIDLDKQEEEYMMEVIKEDD